MGLNVFNFTNPKTRKIVSVFSMDDVHEHLDDLLLDTDQLEKMVGIDVDWDKELKLFDAIEKGEFGDEVRTKFLINCEASMILALANNHFMENPIAVINA
jgi:hypothetical protein